jgi:UDP-glucose 4-epimerase
MTAQDRTRNAPAPPKPLRVLVTGASGRIGTHVVREMVDRGHTVIGLDARDPTAPVPGAQYLRLRLEDLQPGQPELAGVDTVLHLAALMSWSTDDAAAMMHANVDGTFRLVQATALDKPLHRFVFASSGEVYPEMAPQYLPLDEHHPLRPSSYYGMTKLLGEQMLAFYEREFHLSLTVLRFSHVQDPTEVLDPDSFFSGPRFFIRPRLARERAAGNSAMVKALTPYDGPTDTLFAATREDGAPVRMTILAAQDMARAVRMAGELPQAEGQTFGIGPDDAIDLAEFARQMSARTGLPVVEVTVPNTAANYWTLNAKAREVMGFRPSIDSLRFIDLAVASWRERHSSAV